MEQRLDLLQLSRHHVFSDMILTQLPLQALGKLQLSCPQLRYLIQDLPEATWLQAAHTQLPACHPIFSSSHTVCAYLRLHSDIHQGFSPTQVPLTLPHVSVSWVDGMTPSPEFSHAARVLGQQVVLADLSTKQGLGAWVLPNLEPGNTKGSLYFSPSSRHICMIVDIPWGYYILDTKPGEMTAALGPFVGSGFRSWAPNGQQFLGFPWFSKKHAYTVVSVSNNCCKVLAEAQLPAGLHSVWAPDSTAVVMYSGLSHSVWLWSLSEGCSGVKKVPRSSHKIEEMHWGPDSSMICYIAASGQLIWYNRHDLVMRSCDLHWRPFHACFSHSQQPQAVTAVFSESLLTTKFTVCSLTSGHSMSLDLSVHLPSAHFTTPPSLSADGSYLAFTLRISRLWASKDKVCDAIHALHVCSIKTRVTRVLQLDFRPSGLRWAADGARIMVFDGRQCTYCQLA